MFAPLLKFLTTTPLHYILVGFYLVLFSGLAALLLSLLNGGNLLACLS